MPDAAPFTHLQRPERAARAVLLSLLALGLAVPLYGNPPPLTKEEQARINDAIDKGVKYLRHAQLGRGSWAPNLDKHVIGYAALPGLTLLECGVPANDPVVQKAAKLVRHAAPRLQGTYEISLSILFLDRLEDPDDHQMIQTLAVRLLAAQAPSGGWGYKCSIVPAKTRDDILVALRKLTPPAPPGDRDRPPLAGVPADKRPDRPLAGTPAAVKPPLAGMPTERPVRPPLEGTTADRPARPQSVPALPPRPGPAERRPTPGKPEEKGAPAKTGETPAPKPAEAGQEPARVVVPAHIRRLTVFQRLERMPPIDAPRREHELLYPTTDNSNTQFAILALWAAQRHDVPMERTLRLMVHRYDSSQELDGRWLYHYRVDDVPNDRPAMICVGLLGLAVGHGLARPAGAGEQAMPAAVARDRRIVDAFALLARYLRPSTPEAPNPFCNNRYFLWSVERVAVLYDLPAIGERDWYRWGAEPLLASQQRGGYWERSAYPGSTDTADTCFALLFLKRANLVRDLTERIRPRPRELNASITNRANAPPGTPPSPGQSDSPGKPRE
jgi:hypothetical protein